jgi:flagellar biosynthetic protein FliS
MQGIAAYKTNRLNFTPPQQVVALLFQNAYVRLERGQIALETADVTRFRLEARKVRAIFSELLGALDQRAATELSSMLSRLYTWGIRELSAAEREARSDCEAATTKTVNVQKVVESLMRGWDQALKKLEGED